jgi:very-short-patch-repair endonuclease
LDRSRPDIPPHPPSGTSPAKLGKKLGIDRDGIQLLKRLDDMQIDIQRDRARSMRKRSTRAEVMIWSRLRKRGLRSFRFQRQVEIGPYIVDFLNRERAVILELDGATHSESSSIQYDEKRTVFLHDKGYAVFRVTNHEVYTNVEGALDGLLRLLESREPRYQRR